jgi:hypothetical protein
MLQGILTVTPPLREDYIYSMIKDFPSHIMPGSRPGDCTGRDGEWPGGQIRHIRLDIHTRFSRVAHVETIALVRGGHKSGAATVVTSSAWGRRLQQRRRTPIRAWSVFLGPGNIPHRMQAGRGTLGMKLGHILSHEGTAVARRT